jgi:hypothetical protein
MHDIKSKNLQVSELSPHLFWDTPIENIDPIAHSGFIVERVMGRGMINDWNMIKQWYGKEGLRSIVTKLRVLDSVSVAFLCLVLDLKKEEFRCYTEKQSHPNFWNY